MQAMRCPSCAAALHVRDTDRVVTCDHCGTVVDLRAAAREARGGASGGVRSDIKVSKAGRYVSRGAHHSIEREYHEFSGTWSAELRDVQGDAEIRGPGGIMYVRIGRGTDVSESDAPAHESIAEGDASMPDEAFFEVEEPTEITADPWWARLLHAWAGPGGQRAVSVAFGILIVLAVTTLALAMLVLLRAFTR